MGPGDTSHRWSKQEGTADRTRGYPISTKTVSPSNPKGTEREGHPQTWWKLTLEKKGLGFRPGGRVGSLGTSGVDQSEGPSVPRSVPDVPGVVPYTYVLVPVGPNSDSDEVGSEDLSPDWLSHRYATVELGLRLSLSVRRSRVTALPRDP